MIRYFFFLKSNEVRRGIERGCLSGKCPGCAKKKVSKEGYDRRGGGKMKRYMDKSIGHGGFGFNDNTRWDSILTAIEPYWEPGQVKIWRELEVR